MSYRKQSEYCIAAAIASWPLDLCGIVADYATNPIRWSPKQAAGIDVSPDGFEGTIQDMDGLLEVHNNTYQRLIADRPFGETWTTFMLQMTTPNFSYDFRIGILPSGAVDNAASVGPEFSVGRSGITILQPIYQQLSSDSNRLRFCVSADVTTGIVSTRLFHAEADDGDRPELSTAKHVTPAPWFTIPMSPDVLRRSFLVVYFYGIGSKIRIINTGVDYISFR
jgi:hypothetical protein